MRARSPHRTCARPRPCPTFRTISEALGSSTHEVFKTIFDFSPDGIVVVDEHGIVRAANPAAQHLFRAGPGGLAGNSIDQLVPEAQRGRHAGHREQYLASPSPRPMGTDLQLSAMRLDGTSFRAEISLSPISMDDGLFVIAAVRDVTGRQHTRARIALFHDRERIARDLHDRVIQRIYATGMALQAVQPLVTADIPRERVAAAVDELDEVIGELRSAIFGLGANPEHAPLAEQLEAVASERSLVLGFRPDLEIVGASESVDPTVTDHLVATCSEALSNVARHADATAVSITLTVSESRIELVIADNGVGIAKSRRRRGGLSNMMWRAAELGGICEITTDQGEGTVVSWSIPVEIES